MKYGNAIQAEDYFRQTEEYIERMYGNQISEDDLRNRFAREGVVSGHGLSGGEIVDEGYQPQAYELPAGSPFTPKAVSVLGYLAAGVQKVENALEYPVVKGIVEAVRETGGNEVVEQHAMRQLMTNMRFMETNSFFTLEPRYITKHYTREMTQGHQFVRDAVCNNDLDAIADICKRGLDISRCLWNDKETNTLVNRYAEGYVCGQVLDMLERNQELKEKVGLTPEEYNYYRGIARVSGIIREGTKAGEMLTEHPQELTPEQKAEYEKAYSRYHDFSIMTSLEARNRTDINGLIKLQEQLDKQLKEPEMKQKLREKNVPLHLVTGQTSLIAKQAMLRDSELIRRLGEPDQVDELFFEELHDLAQTAQVTGKVRGYDNLTKNEGEEIISQIDKAEGELHNTNIMENILPEEKRLIDSRKDFIQENPKFQGSFQTEMDASIKELKKEDPLLLRSSPQYKGMQAQAKNISEAMETIGDPLTYQDLQRLRHASEALTQSVEAYKQHKEIHHSGSKQELKRIAAADKLIVICNFTYSQLPENSSN